MSNVWLNYHHLFYFRTIAQEGGVAKAARKLRLGQPTLSAQLKILEDTLGHRLFDREGRNLALTEAGRVALDYANEIFRLGGELMEVINDRPKLGRIEAHVGVIDTIPKHVSLEIVEAARAAEDVAVIVHEGKGSDMLRDLKEHRLDLLVLNYPPPVSEATGVKAKKIAKLPILICGSKKYAHLKKQFPQSLQGQPFVMPTPDSQLRHSIEHWLALHDLRVDVVSEAQDTSLQKLLASKGLGLVAVSASAIDESLESRDLVALGELTSVHEEYWLVAGDRKIQNPVAVKLMKSFHIG